MKKDMLAQLQKDFQNYLLGLPTPLNHYIQAPNKKIAQKRLKIYLIDYSERLIEILKRDFKTLAAFMGKNAFKKLAKAYIAAYPSQHFSLRYLGEKLVPFISTQDPYSQKPYLKELAQWDWSLYDILDQEDIPLLKKEDINFTSLDQLLERKFILQPYIHLLQFQFNIVDIWQKSQKQMRNLKAKLIQKESTLLIWRWNLNVCYKALQPAEVLLLQLCKEEKTFLQLCETLETVVPEPSAFVAHTLFNWIQEGLFCGWV